MNRKLFSALGVVLVLGVIFVVSGAAAPNDPLDPVRTAVIPCELVASPGNVPRSVKNLTHLANVCGAVGTDIEFQSRAAAAGSAVASGRG